MLGWLKTLFGMHDEAPKPVICKDSDLVAEAAQHAPPVRYRPLSPTPRYRPPYGSQSNGRRRYDDDAVGALGDVAESLASSSSSPSYSSNDSSSYSSSDSSSSSSSDSGGGGGGSSE